MEYDQLCGIVNYREIMARLGIIDKEEFAEKVSTDPDFNKACEILDAEFTRQQNRELTRRVSDLEEKQENKCCHCCCCGGCC